MSFYVPSLFGMDDYWGMAYHPTGFVFEQPRVFINRRKRPAQYSFEHPAYAFASQWPAASQSQLPSWALRERASPCASESECPEQSASSCAKKSRTEEALPNQSSDAAVASSSTSTSSSSTSSSSSPASTIPSLPASTTALAPPSSGRITPPSPSSSSSHSSLGRWFDFSPMNIDLQENENEFTFTTKVPEGFGEVKTEIDENGTLNVSGQREHSEEKRDEKGNVTTRIRSWSSFSHSRRLPKQDVDKLSVSMTRSGGGITVRVPKKATSSASAPAAAAATGSAAPSETPSASTSSSSSSSVPPSSTSSSSGSQSSSSNGVASTPAPVVDTGAV